MITRLPARNLIDCKRKPNSMAPAFPKYDTFRFVKNVVSLPSTPAGFRELYERVTEAVSTVDTGMLRRILEQLLLPLCHLFGRLLLTVLP
jgi:hypothetical protein